MRLARHTFLILFALAGLFGSAYGQEPMDTVAAIPGIEIETAVDRAESYVGDLIEYTLTITYDPEYDLIPPPLGANLGAFDVKDYRPDIESELPDGRAESKTIFVLSTYTTGDYTIPPLPVVFTLPDSTRKVVLAEPVPIRILSLLDQAGSDSLDIKPLKPQLGANEIFPPDYSRYYTWGGIGLLVLLVGGGLVGWYLWRRWKRKVEIERLPWETAFEKLAFLKVEYLDKAVPDHDRAKAYYVELTEIARAYLGRIYEVDVLEMTTEEFLEAFKDIEWPEELYEVMNGFLRHADQVKFAKFMPERQRIEDDFLTAHDVVEKVRRDYERRREAETRTLDQAAESTPKTEEATV
jgi:hypothetical protein